MRGADPMRLLNSRLGCYWAMPHLLSGILQAWIYQCVMEKALALAGQHRGVFIAILPLTSQAAMRVSFKQVLLTGSTTADTDVTCLQRWAKQFNFFTKCLKFLDYYLPQMSFATVENNELFTDKDAFFMFLKEGSRAISGAQGKA